MPLIFYAPLSQKREKDPCDALTEGARRHGDIIEARPRSAYRGAVDMQADGAIGFGVKMGRDFLTRHWKRGQTTLLLDKGYLRRMTHWRAIVDGMNETWHGLDDVPPDRWDALGIELQPPQPHGTERPVIIATSSVKYHAWAKIKHPTAWAKKLIKDIHLVEPRRTVIYRPKPAWLDAEDIKGAHFSRPPQKLDDILPGAEYLITHGSTAAADAIIAGVPAICLGGSIARPLAYHQVRRGRRVKFPSESRRRAWAVRLAYCQWTLDEFESGLAWKHIRRRMMA